MSPAKLLDTGLAARLADVTAPALAPGVASDMAGGLTETLVSRRSVGRVLPFGDRLRVLPLARLWSPLA